MARGLSEKELAFTLLACELAPSFRKAAESLYVTHQALSARLKTAEKRYGQLVVREKYRKPYLTEAGQTLLRNFRIG